MTTMHDVKLYRDSLPADSYEAALAHCANYYCDGEPTPPMVDAMLVMLRSGYKTTDETEAALMDVIEDDLAAEAC